MRRYPSFSGCAIFYESRREFFEIAEAPHLGGFEKFVILRWREDFLQYIRNFELTFRSRRNSVFYFLAETGEKLHRRTEWSEYFSKQAKNQFFCSRPRVTGLLNICTRLLYPIKPKTAFEIIRRQIVQFAMKTHKVVKVHTIEIQSENFSR